jgi:hypothetical protein
VAGPETLANFGPLGTPVEAAKGWTAAEIRLDAAKVWVAAEMLEAAEVGTTRETPDAVKVGGAGEILVAKVCVAGERLDAKARAAGKTPDAPKVCVATTPGEILALAKVCVTAAGVAASADKTLEGTEVCVADAPGLFADNCGALDELVAS